MGFLHLSDKESAARFADSSQALAAETAAWATVGGAVQTLPWGHLFRLTEIVLVAIFFGSHRVAASARRVADDPPRLDFASRAHASRYRVYPEELRDDGEQVGLTPFLTGVLDADARLDAMRRCIERADGAWLVLNRQAPRRTNLIDAEIEQAMHERVEEARHWASRTSEALADAADGATRLAIRAAESESGPLELSYDDLAYARLYRLGVRIQDTRRALGAFGRDFSAGPSPARALAEWSDAARRYGTMLSELNLSTFHWGE